MSLIVLHAFPFVETSHVSPAQLPPFLHGQATANARLQAFWGRDYLASEGEQYDSTAEAEEQFVDGRWPGNCK